MGLKFQKALGKPPRYAETRVSLHFAEGDGSHRCALSTVTFDVLVRLPLETPEGSWGVLGEGQHAAMEWSPQPVASGGL